MHSHRHALTHICAPPTLRAARLCAPALRGTHTLPLRHTNSTATVSADNLTAPCCLSRNLLHYLTVRHPPKPSRECEHTHTRPAQDARSTVAVLQARNARMALERGSGRKRRTLRLLPSLSRETSTRHPTCTRWLARVAARYLWAARAMTGAQMSTNMTSTMSRCAHPTCEWRELRSASKSVCAVRRRRWWK